MKRIDRPYAIIYLDTEGESLHEGVKDYSTKEIISDYYNMPGFLQWNFYLILPKKLSTGVEITKELQLKIENCDEYSRKFVIPNDSLEQYLEERFPIMEENQGKIYLVKGTDYKDAQKKADQKVKELSAEGIDDLHVRQSFYRDKSLMDSITEMDLMRAMMIRYPSINYLFYSHITDEYFLAEKKFKLFM
jgi:hypothetical protein